jgi:hypothetical protein
MSMLGTSREHIEGNQVTRLVVFGPAALACSKNWSQALAARSCVLAIALTLGLSGCGEVVMGYGAGASSIEHAYNTHTYAAPEPTCSRDKDFGAPKPIRTDGLLIESTTDDYTQSHDYTAERNNHETWSPLALGILLKRNDIADAEFGPMSTYSLVDIAAVLQSMQLDYVEISGPSLYGINEIDRRHWTALGGTSDSGYVRLSRAVTGDAACALYESQKAAAQSGPGWHSPLTGGQCVAVTPIKTPQSAYALEVRLEGHGYAGYSFNQGDQRPQIWRLYEYKPYPQRGEEVAELIRRENHHGVSCPLVETRERFVSLIQPTHSTAR